MSIDSVRGRQLLLSEDYSGPNVTGGEPYVLCRSNLEVVYEFEAEETVRDRRGTKILSCSQPVSAMAAHPSLPFIVLGLVDDQINIISADIGIQSS